MVESYLISKSIKVTKKVYCFYKCSVTEAFLSNISKSISHARYGSAVCNYLSKKESISSWWQNSIIFKLIQVFVNVIIRILGQILSGCRKINDSSINADIFNKFFMPLSDIGNIVQALACVMVGFLSINMVAAYHFHALTQRGFVVRVLLLVLSLLPLGIENQKLSQSFNRSIFIRILRWLMTE